MYVYIFSLPICSMYIYSPYIYIVREYRLYYVCRERERGYYSPDYIELYICVCVCVYICMCMYNMSKACVVFQLFPYGGQVV